MATPRTCNEVFRLIEEEEEKLGNWESGAAGSDLVQQELGKYAHLPFMRGVTAIDYYKWGMADVLEGKNIEQQAKIRARQITAEKFFNIAYEFDPRGTRSPDKIKMPARETELVKLLVTDAVPPIALGMIGGIAPIWLLPKKDVLKASNIDVAHFTSFPVADTDSAGVKYADGHPSFDYRHGDRYFRLVQSPRSGEVLRRFWPLGYLAYQRANDVWDYTGHVMVMDMEPDRERHPWIILAPEWPDTNGEGIDGDFVFRAPRRVRLDASDVHGILPTDHRRTPIGQLIPHPDQKSITDLPFLKQFKPGFKFNVKRLVGEENYKKSRMYADHHPDLVHIMTWYWDDEEKEEVCYSEDGKEYMRYNPSLKDPNLDAFTPDEISR